MRRVAAICVLWILSMTAGVGVACAAVEERQVLALIRALAYDRHLGERAGADVSIAVVYDDAHETSARAINEVLRSLDGVTLQDRPIVSGAPVALGGTLAESLVESLSGIDVVVVVTAAGVASGVVEATRSAGGVTVGFDAGLIAAGVPLVVSDESGELEVIINLPASRAAGQSYSSKLLQIAHVVRESP